LVRARLEQETYGLTEIQGYFAREKLDPRLGARTRVTVAFFGYENNLASIKVFMEVLICTSVFVFEFASIKAGDYESKFFKGIEGLFFSNGQAAIRVAQNKYRLYDNREGLEKSLKS